jgi:PBSX family phage portal protein
MAETAVAVPAEDLKTATAASDRAIEAFTFGDPEPVLAGRVIMDHIECWRNGRWYEPPISLDGLTRSFTAAPHHQSALILKRNLLASSFVPSRELSREEFKAFAHDYLVLGNGYLQERLAMSGRPLSYTRVVSRWTRVGVDLESYWFLTHGAVGGTYGEVQLEGRIAHLKEPDLSQEIYGLPEYISALQAAFLNEAATIFRRRYYANGSHAGFILYSTDAQLERGDVDILRQALKDSKGPGNFRNLFLHAPGGKGENLKLIPISEVAAKDEFLNIKNVSRDDVLAAHRVPPQLLGVIPQNTGGFGDVAKARDVFQATEIQALQETFLGVNEMVGREIIRFRAYEPMSQPSASQGGPARG